ncbi:MAG: FlgD immunoglobulin-like domain containing protein [Candidatus Cloacimonetes bacterium]|nr:FlgD immunoglobulin-like domain containing protein [Candidatus Cloacimonadota bacterium]
MKPCLFTLMLVLVSLSLVAEPVWDAPLVVRESREIFYQGSWTPTTDDCVIRVWSEVVQGDREIVAAKIHPDGTTLWRNLIVCKEGVQNEPQITKTLDNNYLVIWQDYNDSYDADIYAQKISLSGQILWAEDGIPISNTYSDKVQIQLLSNPDADPYITWLGYGTQGWCLFGQKLSPTGETLWQDNGLVLINDPHSYSALVDANAGLMISYTKYIDGTIKTYAQHFDAQGQPLWTQPLVFLPEIAQSRLHNITRLSDGSYLVCIQHFDDSLGGISLKLCRFDGAGNFLWTEPVSLMSGITNNIDCIELTATNSDIFFTASVLDIEVVTQTIFCHKLNYTGEKLWGADGIQIAEPIALKSELRHCPDTEGGIYLAWTEYGNYEIDQKIKAQHISSSGSPLWDASSGLICDLGGHRLMRCISYLGGLVQIAWEGEHEGQKGIYQQVLSPAGQHTLDANGEAISTGLAGSMLRHSLRMIRRANDTAVFWIDQRADGGTYNLYCQIVSDDGQFLLEDNGLNLGICNEHNEDAYDVVLGTDNELGVVFPSSLDGFESIRFLVIDSAGDVVTNISAGAALTTQIKPRISYEAGSFYLGWNDFSYGCAQVFGQKITQGELMWGPNGIQLTGNPPGQYLDNMLEAVSGRYYSFIHTTQSPSYEPRTLLLEPSGLPAPGWNKEGNSVMSAQPGYHLSFDLKSSIKDGDIYLSWHGYYGSEFELSHYLQKVGADGTLLWGEDAYVCYTEPMSQYYQIYQTDEALFLLTALEELATNHVEYALMGLQDNGSLFWPETLLIETQCHTVGDMDLSGFSDGDFLVGVSSYDNHWQSHYYTVDRLGTISSPPGGFSLSRPNMQNSDIACQGFGEYALIGWDEFYYELYPQRGDAIPHFTGLFLMKAQNPSMSKPDEGQLPVPNLALGNYPNPFNPNTTISFILPQAQTAKLNIYNLKGQLTKTLHQGKLSKGKHEFSWNGTDQNGSPAASGVYFLRLETGGNSYQSKMLMLK